MADVVPLLTAAQLQQFIVQGYVIFDAGLTDEFNAGLASRLDSVETAAEPNPGNNILPDVPEIAHVVRAPAIQGALTSILGPHYTLQPHRFAHVNHPGARPQMQHRDSFYGYYKYRSHYPWEAILFYYPRAVELAMGPTALLPFSQYSHRHYKDVEVVKKIPAGTAILCHYNLWHRGTGNSHESNIRVMVKLQFARLVAPSPSWFPYATEDVDAGVFREAVDWASVYDQCYVKDAQKSATLALTPVFERVWRWLHGDHPECYASPPPTVEEEAQYLQLLPLAAPLREDKSNAAGGDDDEDMMSAPPPSKSPPPKKAQPKKGGANATPKPVADDRAVLGAVYRLASSPRVVEHLQSLFTSKAEGWWNGPMKAGDAKMPSIGQYIGMIGVAAVTHALGDGRREDVRDFLMKLSNDAALPVEARWCALHGVFAAPYHSAVVLRFVRSYLLTHAHRPTGEPRFVPGMLLERVVAEGLRTAVAGVGDSAVDSEYIALIVDATKAAATATIVDAQSRFTLMLSVSAALMSGALTTVAASAVANPLSGAKKKKDRLGFGGKARPARAATTSPPPAVAGGDELEEEEVDDGASVTSVGSTASSNKQAALRSAALDGFVGDVQRIASNDTNRYARGFAAALYAALAVAPLDSNAAPDERSHAAEVVMTTRRCPFTSPQSQFVEKSERW